MRSSACRERLQKESLLAIKTVPRTLARRAVNAHIRDAVEPELSLVIDVRIVQERATVDEIAALVAHGPLDLAFVRARYGRQARGVKPQCCAKRRNSALRTSAPPSSRKSRVITAFI